MFSPSSERVLANSSPMITDQIRRKSEVSVHYYKDHLEEIEHRLWELDREWDVERALQVWDSSATLIFFLLWLFGFGSWWMLLLFLVQAFALAHALHGWSPMLMLLRHLNFRTQGEIEWERFSLKDLRTMSLPPGSLSLGALATPSPVAAPAGPSVEVAAPSIVAPASGSTEPAAAAPSSTEAPAPTPQVKPVEGMGSVEIQI